VKHTDFNMVYEQHAELVYRFLLRLCGDAHLAEDLMQDTFVDEKCCIDTVITDKNVEIGEGKVLTGSSSYPLYIGKGAKI